jgi:hypothetical protein
MRLPHSAIEIMVIVHWLRKMRVLCGWYRSAMAIYTGGRTKTAIKQASYGRDAAREQVTSVQRQLTTQTRTAF